jgi:hypothetical protein
MRDDFKTKAERNERNVVEKKEHLDQRIQELDNVKLEYEKAL